MGGVVKLRRGDDRILGDDAFKQAPLPHLVGAVTEDFADPVGNEGGFALKGRLPDEFAGDVDDLAETGLAFAQLVLGLQLRGGGRGKLGPWISVSV